MKCETCQSEATVHIVEVGCYFCESCLQKIDKRIAEINLAKDQAENLMRDETAAREKRPNDV